MHRSGVGCTEERLQANNEAHWTILKAGRKATLSRRDRQHIKKGRPAPAQCPPMG